MTFNTCGDKANPSLLLVDHPEEISKRILGF